MKKLLKLSTILILMLPVSLVAQTTELIKIPTTTSSSFTIPKNAVTIIAWTKIKAGSEDKVMKATKIMTEKIRKNESGNLIFEAHQGAIAPGTIIFYEVFKDSTAFEIHKNAVYVKEWFQAIEGLTTIPMEVNLVNNLDTY